MWRQQVVRGRDHEAVLERGLRLRLGLLLLLGYQMEQVLLVRAAAALPRLHKHAPVLLERVAVVVGGGCGAGDLWVCYMYFSY